MSFRCPYCNCEIAVRSRRRPLEKLLLRVVFLRPVRCQKCRRRYYRSIFMETRESLRMKRQE